MVRDAGGVCSDTLAGNAPRRWRVWSEIRSTPDDLRVAIDKENEEYNERPHEALKNVCPNDVYAGRKEEVLERRAKIKLETMARRYAYNMGTDAGTAN